MTEYRSMKIYVIPKNKREREGEGERERERESKRYIKLY